MTDHLHPPAALDERLVEILTLAAVSDDNSTWQPLLRATLRATRTVSEVSNLAWVLTWAAAEMAVDLHQTYHPVDDDGCWTFRCHHYGRSSVPQAEIQANVTAIIQAAVNGDVEGGLLLWERLDGPVERVPTMLSTISALRFAYAGANLDGEAS